MANDLDFDRADKALKTLRSTSSPFDRLGALTEVVGYWHGPIAATDGIPAAELAGIVMPDPLRWWYRWAGQRNEIMSGQNSLCLPTRSSNPKPRQLRMEHGRLLFNVENQYCYVWSTLTEGEDPPVFGRDNEDAPWQVETVSLIEHLILVCIFEAVICHAKVRACSAWLGEDKFQAIVRRIPALLIGPWRWCETAFHVGSGAFMLASPVGEQNDMRYSVWIGAKREGSLDFLKPLLGDEWEHFDL